MTMNATLGMPPKADKALRAENIFKRFGAIQALDDVSFELLPGEIHAVVGENGAGKSTLVKILGGVLQKDRGRIFKKNAEIENLNPSKASQLGINVIHQEIRLLNNASIGENIFVNHEPKRNGFIDWRSINGAAKEILTKLGLDVDPRRPVRELGVAARQIVQIAKAVSLKTDVLIMDEPTAALSDDEVDSLFNLVRRLRSEGVSVIYISHRLDEIISLADRITVLRNGKNVDTIAAGGASKAQIIHMMIGRDMQELYPKKKVALGDPVLELQSVGRGSMLSDVTFQLKAGEILGFAGLQGSGVKDLAYIVAGMVRMDRGQMFTFGTRVRFFSPADAIANGIGFVPEDRRKIGLCMGLSVEDNVTMAGIRYCSTFGFIRRKSARQLTSTYVEQLAIKCANARSALTSLSGGNQQKVVIAKWLATRSKILVLYEPTFGVDIGARAEIYSIISDLVASGVGIVMISSDTPELIGMSDRIICLRKGRINGEFRKENGVNEAQIRACL
jgi:ABC-type sugar transport system ATPase subunit